MESHFLTTPAVCLDLSEDVGTSLWGLELQRELNSVGRGMAVDDALSLNSTDYQLADTITDTSDGDKVTSTGTAVPDPELPKAKQLLADNALTLFEYALSIQKSFRWIAEIIASASKKGSLINMDAGLRGRCVKLRKTWDRLDKDCMSLISHSRVVAGNARITVRGFSGAFVDILGSSHTSLQFKEVERKKMKKKLDVDQRNAYQISQRFEDLHDRVENFREELTEKEYAPTSAKGQTENLGLFEMGGYMEGKRVKSQPSYAGSSEPWHGSGNRQRQQHHRGTPALWNNSGMVYQNLNLGEKRRAQETEALRLQEDLEAETVSICEKLVAFSSVWMTIGDELRGLEETSIFVVSSGDETLCNQRVRDLKTMACVLLDELETYESHTEIPTKS
ncbi:hypothetical protein BV22DRAFT_1132534 [Leucogyrophana mollusca]|uniref:Uncharacterized protein n=1 Tax=Leucogyrophana mollusca TaxID=85980 RepID=A0ACB8B642_9AGAM|nr:hypothetical protein BV22DRAFT_1132534 [Leucogyrophana mollusca]